MSNLFLGINYVDHESKGAEYQAVEITDITGTVVAKWNTGNAVEDWTDMIEWVRANQIMQILESSSVQHFAMDTNEYTFDEHDMIVRLN